MSYPLSAPVDFSAPGPVSLTLTNTTSPGSIVWEEATNATDELVFGTNHPISSNVLHLYPDSGADPRGAAQTPRLRLERAGFGVNLDTDPGLAATYNFRMPALPPTGDAQIIASQGLTNVFYDVHPKNTIIVRKNPGPGEFATLYDAIASIPTVGPNAPSTTNMYNIKVFVGRYQEIATCVVPSFVFIVGESMDSVIFEPAAMGYSILKFNATSGMAFCGISGSDPSLPAIDCNNCGYYVILHKITVADNNCQRFVSCITDGTATDDSYLYLEYVDTTDALIYTLFQQDTNPLGGFGSIVNVENFFTYGHNDDAIIVDGENTYFLSHASELDGDGTGNCIRVKNGGHVNIRGMAISNYTNGFLVDNDGKAPHIVTAGITFADNTININMPNDLTTGQADGYTAYLKTLVPKAAPFFITNKDQHIITVGSKGADFTSVVAALAAITDNSPTERYTIYVGPGVYVETQIVLKPYVAILGFFQTQCILQADPSIAGMPFVIGAGYSAIDKLTLSTASYATPPSYLVEFQGDPAGVHFRCDNIVFDSSADYVHVGSQNGLTIFLLLNALFNMSAPFVNGVYIEDSGPSNYPITFAIDNLIWGADAVGVTSVNELITVRSFKAPSSFQNIFGAVTNSSLGTNFYGPAGIGFTIEGAVYIVVETCVFGGMVTGLQVLSSAEPTFMILASSTISNNTNDIKVLSATAFGSISVNAAISKTTIDPASNFGIVLNDPAGSVAFGGDLYQNVRWDRITNISNQIQHASTTGVMDEQTPIASVGGLNISVGAGQGYVFVGPLVDNYLKYVTWTAVPSLALVDNSLNWIYVDPAGVVSITPSDPDPVQSIVLGAVKTYGGNVTYIQEIAHRLDNLATNIDDVLRDGFGPIVKSGCIAGPGSSLVERAVQVSSGSYFLSVDLYPPTGGDNVSMIGYYGGTVETAPFTNIPLQWDNAGVLTALVAGQWVKHAIYILSSLAGATQYFMVYAQQTFASELDAQNGPIPTPPTTFVGNMCMVSGVIVTFGDPSSPLAPSRFRDIRPVLGFKSEGTTASADHNSLLNLTVGNAHPQYFRVDGTSVMVGSINLAGNNIFGTGGNLLNGVDITAHASRHLPGGADALATAIPVSIGSVNALGAAAAFSRADHVHRGVSSVASNGGTAEVGAINLVNGTNVSIVDSPVGTFTFNVPTGAGGVTTFSAGTTGLTPAVATSGAITLSGTLVAANGGTGFGTYTIGDLLYADTSSTLARLADVAVNNALISGGVGVAPSWGKVNNATLVNSSITVTAGTGLSGGGLVSLGGSVSLNNAGVLSISSDGGASEIGALSLISGTNVTIVDSPAGTFTFNVPTGAGGVTTFSGGTTGLTPAVATSGAITLSGTLVAANGGTGFGTYTIGDLLYANTSSTLARLADVAVDNALISGGVGVAPSWGKISNATLVNSSITVTAGTGLSGGGAVSLGGSIVLSANSLTTPQIFPINTTQTSVGGALTVIGYMPWQNSQFSSYTTRTVTAWVVPSSVAGKNLTISVLPNGGASLGSILINGGSAVGAIYTFTFTDPGVDTNVQIAVSRIGGAGNNPIINGVSIKVA